MDSKYIKMSLRLGLRPRPLGEEKLTILPMQTPIAGFECAALWQRELPERRLCRGRMYEERGRKGTE